VDPLNINNAVLLHEERRAGPWRGHAWHRVAGLGTGIAWTVSLPHWVTKQYGY